MVNINIKKGKERNKNPRPRKSDCSKQKRCMNPYHMSRHEDSTFCPLFGAVSGLYIQPPRPLPTSS